MVRKKRHIEMTEKHFDTLKLTYTEWNDKYGSKSKNHYYTIKKRMLTYLEEQGSVDS
jgi:hypothetical protein